MGAPITVEFDLINDEVVTIPLNRWARSNYAIQIDTGELLVEGTLSQINRENVPFPVFATVNDTDGTPLGTASTGIHNIEFIPLSAIRITSDGPTIGRLVQQGQAR